MPNNWTTSLLKHKKERSAILGGLQDNQVLSVYWFNLMTTLIPTENVFHVLIC